MYCFNCGSKIADDAAFCGECGAKQDAGEEPIQWPVQATEDFAQNKVLQIEESPNQMPEPIQPQQPIDLYMDSPAAKKSGGDRKTAIIIVFIVAAVILLGGAYYVFNKMNKPQTDSIAMKDRLEKEEMEDEPEEVQSSVPEKEAFAEDVTEEPELPAEEGVPMEEAEEEMPQYMLPNSDRVKLNVEDLRRLSQEDLRIARNEIYARHGRMFQDEQLQSYFDNCEWYIGVYEPNDFPESLLNETEMFNRDLITEYEEYMGYR